MKASGSGETPNQRVSPRAVCPGGREIVGEAPLADFPRLTAFMPDEALGGSTPPTVHYRIVFYEDPGGARRARVAVETRLALTCSRCMAPMLVPVHGEGAVQFVYSDDQAAQVDAAYEPVQTDEEGLVSVLELIEDEVLMALPVVARHEAACRAPWHETEAGEPVPTQEEDTERRNPFAALAALKSNKKDS